MVIIASKKSKLEEIQKQVILTLSVWWPMAWNDNSSESSKMYLKIEISWISYLGEKKGYAPFQSIYNEVEWEKMAKILKIASYFLIIVT